MSRDTFGVPDGNTTDGTRQASSDCGRRLTRRRALAAAGAACIAGVAGCLGGDDDGSAETGGQDTAATATEAIGATAATTTTTPTDAWRTYQRDNRNSGFSPVATGPGADPEVAWTGTVEHTDGPATVVEGTVYVGGPGKVYAYDAASGEEQWTYDVGDMVDAAVTVVDGAAVFPARDGNVYALSAADGSEQWVRSEVNGASVVAPGDLGIKQGSATVTDGTVYVTKEETRQVSMYGLDLATGDVTAEIGGWGTDDGKDGFVNTPAIVDGTAYLGAKSGHVYAVDLDSGEIDWSAEVATTIFGSPAVVDGSVYVTDRAPGESNKPVLLALDAASGDTRWNYDLGPEEHGSRSLGSVCVTRDAVIASNRNGVVQAVERDDGTERWTFDTGRRIYGATSADPERVYVGNDGGTVYALDHATGDVIWQFEDSSVKAVDASPTPIDGTLYVTSDDGSLVALTAS